MTLKLLLRRTKDIQYSRLLGKAADGEYRDIAHPINSETRDRIQKVILDKYETSASEALEPEMA